MKPPKKFQGETTDYSVHGLAKAEPVKRPKPAPPRRPSLRPDSPLNADETLRELTLALDPVAFFARIALWRRTDVSGAQYEPRVSGTRDAKMLAFDITDEKLNAAEAEYRSLLTGVSIAMTPDSDGACDERQARYLLREARKLEEFWCTPIITPDAEMAKELGRLVSDAQSCNTCGDTKEAYVRRAKKRGIKTPLWKRRGGDCTMCWQKKRRARLAELQAAEDAAVAS